MQGRGGADGRARLPVRNECDVGRRGEAAEIVDEARLVAPVLCVDVQKQLRLCKKVFGFSKLSEIQIASRLVTLMAINTSGL